MTHLTVKIHEEIPKDEVFVFVNHGLILFELLAISVNATWSCDVKEDIDSIFTLLSMR